MPVIFSSNYCDLIDDYDPAPVSRPKVGTSSLRHTILRVLGRSTSTRVSCTTGPGQQSSSELPDVKQCADATEATISSAPPPDSSPGPSLPSSSTLPSSQVSAPARPPPTSGTAHPSTVTKDSTFKATHAPRITTHTCPQAKAGIIPRSTRRSMASKPVNGVSKSRVQKRRKVKDPLQVRLDLEFKDGTVVLPSSATLSQSLLPTNERPSSSSDAIVPFPSNEDNLQKASALPRVATDPFPLSEPLTSSKESKQSEKRKETAFNDGSKAHKRSTQKDIPEVKESLEPKNSTHTHDSGNTQSPAVTASECGHMIHPAFHGEYIAMLCPPCTVRSKYKQLVTRQQRITELNQSMTIWHLRHTYSYQILVKGEKKLASKKDHRGKERRTGGWRTTKRNLTNYVEDTLPMWAQREMDWEIEHLVGVPEEEWADPRPYRTDSAQRALLVYEDLEEQLSYVLRNTLVEEEWEGGPSVAINESPLDSTAATNEQPRIPQNTRSAIKRKRDETEIETERRPTKRLTFNKDVYVSKTHDIDDPDKFKSPSASSEPSPLTSLPSIAVTGYVAPKVSHTCTWLNEAPSRFIQKRNSAYYSPGLWFSPEGYEKANTSWSGKKGGTYTSYTWLDDDEQEPEMMVENNQTIGASAKVVDAGSQEARRPNEEE